MRAPLRRPLSPAPTRSARSRSWFTSASWASRVSARRSRSFDSSIAVSVARRLLRPCHAAAMNESGTITTISSRPRPEGAATWSRPRSGTTPAMIRSASTTYDAVTKIDAPMARRRSFDWERNVTPRVRKSGAGEKTPRS